MEIEPKKLAIFAILLEENVSRIEWNRWKKK